MKFQKLEIYECLKQDKDGKVIFPASVDILKLTEYEKETGRILTHTISDVDVYTTDNSFIAYQDDEIVAEVEIAPYTFPDFDVQIRVEGIPKLPSATFTSKEPYVLWFFSV